ncbi:MAG TPA: hypothetical protein VGP93_13240 [Polyangiaceae bacterium]|nr:hypothetical protein [Polyangiaceae bacterium]
MLGSTQSLLGPAGHDAVERLLREGRAANVFVKRSARDSSLYVMRTGSERAGALRAVIILLEEDPEFFEGAV